MNLSQVKYCGGYSGEDPPLPIPNREVKLTSADGTATPSGRVGSCRFSNARLNVFSRAFLFIDEFGNSLLYLSVMNDKASIWNSAGKAGLALGGVSAAYLLIVQLLS